MRLGTNKDLAERLAGGGKPPSATYISALKRAAGIEPYGKFDIDRVVRWLRKNSFKVRDVYHMKPKKEAQAA